MYENWPLYEVLKLFREGHGHMAVVVKYVMGAKESSQKYSDNVNLQSIATHSDIQPKETKAEGEGEGEGELPNNGNIYHRNNEILSRSLDNDDMKQGEGSRPFNRWEQVDGNISTEEVESLTSRFVDDEVVGIITMEDVLEELLQVKFLSCT